MGKGDDPNSCVVGAVAMTAAELPPAVGAFACEEVFGWPNPNDLDGILARLHPDDWFDRTPEGELRATPAGDPQLWREMIDGYQCPRTGLRVSIPPRNDDRDNPGYFLGRLFMSADILDDGEPIGDIGLNVTVGPHGRPELRLGAMELTRHPDHSSARDRDFTRTAGGFATAFLDHVECRAALAGVGWMSVHAVGSGAYAWSRRDFDWDPRRHDHPDASQARARMAAQTAERMHHRLQEHARAGELPERAPREFRAWVSSLNVPPTPGDLGQWGREYQAPHPQTGRLIHAGAAAMVSVDWEGVKSLRT